MIVHSSDLAWAPKMGIRNGKGPARSADYLRPGDLAGVMSAGRTELEPGSSVGEHTHADSDELYLIVEGHGTGVLNGVRFPVAAGDLFVLKAGGSHGLENTSDAPLAFFGLLTRPGA
jgi:mannose-6-phosphate isomerase-like protein (cupin superfamily)